MGHDVGQILDQPHAPQEPGRAPLQDRPPSRRRISRGFDKPTLQAAHHQSVDEVADRDRHGVADHRFDEHALQAARVEDDEDQEGGADRNAEPGQYEDHQRRDQGPPLEDQHLRNLRQPAIGQVAVTREIAIHEHRHQDTADEYLEQPPGPVGVRAEERAERLDGVVGNHRIAGQDKADDHGEMEADAAVLRMTTAPIFRSLRRIVSA